MGGVGTSYLDHLAQLLHCEYLSDLRSRTISPGEAREILFDEEVFSPRDYQDAARYLTGNPDVSDDPAAARRLIANHLMGHD